jgi:hypothetical protein
MRNKLAENISGKSDESNNLRLYNMITNTASIKSQKGIRFGRKHLNVQMPSDVNSKISLRSKCRDFSDL